MGTLECVRESLPLALEELGETVELLERVWSEQFEVVEGQGWSVIANRGRESVLLPLPPNRAGGSPAYGSPVGGFTWLRIDMP